MMKFIHTVLPSRVLLHATSKRTAILGLGTYSVLSLAISSAHAAGIEYTMQSVKPFFEKGNYAEMTYGHVDLSLDGKDVPNGDAINDMMDSFKLPSAAVKIAPTANSAVALIYETPFGVDVTYPSGSMFSNELGTTKARVDTQSFTLLGGGKVNNIWLYGGIEYQTIDGDVTVATPVGLNSALAAANVTPEQFTALMTAAQAGDSASIATVNSISSIAQASTFYELNLDKSDTITPVIGIAYEKPEIALRVGVTYRAPAKHSIDVKESLNIPALKQNIAPAPNAIDVDVPQSVNVDFQTGLSEKHQLLGRVNARWVHWKGFEVNPPLSAEASGEPLASYDKDGYAVEVALAKQFTPQFSGEVGIGYDNGTGDSISLLGPYRNMKSIILGGQYQINNNLSIGAGGQYMWLEGGDVATRNDGVISTINDGTGYAVGVKLGYHF